MPCRVLFAPARIALRTRVWVVPAVVLRGSEDPAIIRRIIDTSVLYEPTDSAEEDMYRLTAVIMASPESNIRRYPEQRFVFRRMWNNQAEVQRTEFPLPSNG